MPLPAFHGVLGAIAVVLIHPRTSFRHDWFLLILGAFLAVTPDFDFFFVWILGWGDDWHRGFTHSIPAAAVFTLLLYLAKMPSHFRSVLALGAALLSHSVLDYLTTKFDGGVELLFPFSDERFRLGLAGYVEGTQDFTIVDYLKVGLIESIAVLPLFVLVLWFGGYLSIPDRGKRDF